MEFAKRKCQQAKIVEVVCNVRLVNYKLPFIASGVYHRGNMLKPGNILQIFIGQLFVLVSVNSVFDYIRSIIALRWIWKYT